MKKHVLIIAAVLQFSHSFSQNKSVVMQAPTQESIEIIRYNIPEGKHAEFEKAYSKAEEILQTSPVCHGFQLIHGEEEPNHYIVIIHWTSSHEHVNNFRKSQQFGPFFNLVQPFFSDIEEMKHYGEVLPGFKK